MPEVSDDGQVAFQCQVVQQMAVVRAFAVKSVQHNYDWRILTKAYC